MRLNPDLSRGRYALIRLPGRTPGKRPRTVLMEVERAGGQLWGYAIARSRAGQCGAWVPVRKHRIPVPLTEQQVLHVFLGDGPVNEALVRQVKRLLPREGDACGSS